LLVDCGKEVLNGLAFGTIRRRGESHVNGLVRNSDPPRRREDVRNDLLCLSWTLRVRGDQRCEFGLRVRADDADHVDDPFELSRVPDELASERGLFDGCVSRGLRAQRLKIALKLKRGDEILLDGCAPELAERWRRARKLASCVALGDTRKSGIRCTSSVLPG